MAESLETDISDQLETVKDMSLGDDKTLDCCSYSNPSISLEGSVVASPSIESFSTLPDGESSLNLADEVSDLAVRVDSPQKHSELLDTFVTFRVTSRTNRSEFPGTEFNVRRRYNDFVWLRQSLTEAYPTHFIPPLPVKHTIIGQLDRYGREFVTARMAALHNFLSRIVKHPVLSCAPCLKCFLTCTTEELQQLRRLTTPGLLSKVSSSLQSLTTLHLMPERSMELERLDHTLEGLTDKIGHVLKISGRIHKERTDELNDLNDFKSTLQGWAGTESTLTDDLCELASAVDKTKISLGSVLLDTESCILTQPLKEYLLYIDAVKEALDRRDVIDLQHQSLSEVLDKKTSEQAELEGGEPEGGSVLGRLRGMASRSERLGKLKETMPLFQKQLEDSKDKLVCADENIRSDLERWNTERKNDIKNILVTFSDQHIQYYEQRLRAWTELSQHLELECNGNPS